MDSRSGRPLEEYWLLALMCLLVCAGLLFLGILFIANSEEVTALAVSPESPTPVPTATLPATFTPAPPVITNTNTPIVPAARVALMPTASPTRVKLMPGAYRVQNGDTLLGIAYRAGLTLDEVLLANPNIKNPNKLALNQLIKIPEGGKAPVGAAPQSIPTYAVVKANGGVLTYPQMGVAGGYVPLGAMSISAEHWVKGKRYSAGSFEYLHGLYNVPFPLPDISKDTIKLPPPIPADICPLTGLPLGANWILNRKPLNVRIDNAPAARPQSGLGSADIVFETLAEGGITRFTAVFLCNAADADIGPIRSARLIDLQLTPMFKAILVHVGASQPVLDMIWSSEIGEADFDPVFRGTFGFGRIQARPAPHNVYASIGSLWSVASNAGLNGPVDLQGLSFSKEVPPGGGLGSRASVPYNFASDVSYVYDSGLYSKLIGGAPHVDANTKQPLRFANVILLYAKATYTDALEDGIASRSLHFGVQGAGRAVLLRDGQSFEAVWHHEGRNILFHFTDAGGNHIPLKPGATMINIVPLELHVTVE